MPRNSKTGVIKIGYFKKNISMRKKFFVLREGTAKGGPSRIEYYGSERKWTHNGSPKKVILLKNCFNIDRCVDSRTKITLINLYTKENYFSIYFDCKKEFNEWFELITGLQRVSCDLELGDSIMEHFGHNIWHISILKKELGLKANLLGMTGLSVYDKKVTIMKYPAKSKKPKTIDIMLTSIRCCGVLDTLFYMEVGQSSPFGSGHIWMDTWNTKIAKSVHEIIMRASSQSYDLSHRMRLSSFDDASQLINCPSEQRSRFNVSSREQGDSVQLRSHPMSIDTASSMCSFNVIKYSSCISANSSISACKNSSMNTSNVGLKSTDITAGASLFQSLSDHHSTILEEIQGDNVSHTPLSRDVIEMKHENLKYKFPGYCLMASVKKISEYMPMTYKQRSIKSETPSTNIHLDKVCALEDEEPIKKPTKAYSVSCKQDSLREKFDKLNDDRPRTRSFSIDGRGQLPPTGLSNNRYSSGSTSMYEQSDGDGGDCLEMNFSRNSTSQCNHSETSRTLSNQTSRSSPKLSYYPDVSCARRSIGTLPKSIVSSLDINNTLSETVNGIFKLAPASSHTFLSPTLKNVSERPYGDLVDDYIIMKPGPGYRSKNKNVMYEESSNTLPKMKKVGGLSLEKPNTTSFQEHSAMIVHEADDNYTTVKPSIHSTLMHSELKIIQPSDTMLDVLRDGFANISFSDQPNIV